MVDTSLYEDPTFRRYVAAEVQVESGGDYNAVSPAGAEGAYQILASNIPGWSKAALGHSITAGEFTKNHQEQDTIAYYKFAQYWGSHQNVGSTEAQVKATAHNWNPDAEGTTYEDAVWQAFQQVGPGASFGSPANSVSGVDKHPPIPLGTVHAPLSPKERQTILTYLSAHGMSEGDIAAFVTGGSFAGQDPDVRKWAIQTAMKEIKAGKHDTGLIAVYKKTVNGEHLHDGSGDTQNRINNPFAHWWDGLVKIFDWLTTASNWKRIGLGALGVAILVFAVVKAFKSG